MLNIKSVSFIFRLNGHLSLGVDVVSEIVAREN